jgi:RNA polymerase sigma-70 factor (ECF subfamily)
VRRGLENALDEYLVLLAQAGDAEAFARLAARWTPKLLTFASRSTGSVEAAKDAVQDTWTSVVAAIRRLEDPARFPSWIYAIAARKCTDVLRARYRNRRVADAMERLPGEEENEAASADLRLDLRQALRRLPREQRVAIALLYGEDMSVAEIAAITGVPPGTVKSRLSAARQALRAFMEGNSDEQT